MDLPGREGGCTTKAMPLRPAVDVQSASTRPEEHDGGCRCRLPLIWIQGSGWRHLRPAAARRAVLAVVPNGQSEVDRLTRANSRTTVEARSRSAQTRTQPIWTNEGGSVTLQLLGKDPDSPSGSSPTVYYDSTDDTYVLQGWKITDPATLAEMDIPPHETVIRLPRRMTQFFMEVTGGQS
jgi:hypothetical protein